MYKKCTACGAVVDESVTVCPKCGAASLVAQMDEVQQLEADPMQIPENKGHGNIIAGIVGAFLFSAIGGLLYFIIYQVGFVAGICGLAMFLLASFGYRLFAKTKNTASAVGFVAAIVATIVMIYLAEYFCLSFEIFLQFDGVTLFDAIRVTPEFLAEPEISDAVAGDLAAAYTFAAIAIIGSVVKTKKERKSGNTK